MAVGNIVALSPSLSQQAGPRAQRVVSAVCEVTQGVGHA